MSYTKIVKSKFSVIARCFQGSDSFLAKVPVIMTTIPEVPEVIIIGKHAYLLMTTNPVTYRCAVAAKAKKV